MNSPRINETIKRFSIVVIMVCAAIIAGLIVAGKASADGYLSPQEERMGDAVSGPLCKFIDQVGVNEFSMTKAVEILYENTPGYMDETDAVDIINYVVQSYCPSHWDDLVAFGDKYRSGEYA